MPMINAFTQFNLSSDSNQKHEAYNRIYRNSWHIERIFCFSGLSSEMTRSNVLRIIFIVLVIVQITMTKTLFTYVTHCSSNSFHREAMASRSKWLWSLGSSNAGRSSTKFIRNSYFHGSHAMTTSLRLRPQSERHRLGWGQLARC